MGARRSRPCFRSCAYRSCRGKEEALPGDFLTTSKHVMVLVKPDKNQKVTRILHQNEGNKRFVITDVLRSKQGVTIWRPVK